MFSWFFKCCSSCSWLVMKRMYLLFISSYDIGEFSIRDWMTRSIWLTSSGLLITRSKRGFFYLRHLRTVSKNLRSLSSSKEAKSRSSPVIASPIPNSSCSEPDAAMVPPKVMVHLIVDQTEESIPAKYSRQDYLCYWTCSLCCLSWSTGSSS